MFCAIAVVVLVAAFALGFGVARGIEHASRDNPPPPRPSLPAALGALDRGADVRRRRAQQGTAPTPAGIGAAIGAAGDRTRPRRPAAGAGGRRAVGQGAVRQRGRHAGRAGVDRQAADRGRDPGGAPAERPVHHDGRRCGQRHARRSSAAATRRCPRPRRASRPPTSVRRGSATLVAAAACQARHASARSSSTARCSRARRSRRTGIPPTWAPSYAAPITAVMSDAGRDRSARIRAQHEARPRRRSRARRRCSATPTSR